MLLEILYVAEMFFIASLASLALLIPFIAYYLLKSWKNLSDGDYKSLSSRIFELSTEVEDLEKQIDRMEKQVSFMYKKFLEIWQDDYSRQRKK